jgi:plastocyanin
MNTHILPEWLCVQNFKLVMRSLLGLWTALVVLGLGIYSARYLAPKAVPATGLSPLALLSNALDDVQIHADEMAAAAGRGELATAKRHAEHLVNLIVGKNSQDYGDLDGNGAVEDPGDGKGAVNYLAQVRSPAQAGADSGADPGAAAAAVPLDHIHSALVGIVGDAKAVLQAQDAGQVSGQVQQAGDLAAGLRGSPESLINLVAQAMGVQLARPTVSTGPTSAAPQTVTVLMENFVFSPQKLTVKKGTTIVFVNRDVAKHTVTEDSGKFNSGNIDSGQSYTLKLDEPGTYPYYCAFHGDQGGVDMAGVIEVTP